MCKYSSELEAPILLKSSHKSPVAEKKYSVTQKTNVWNLECKTNYNKQCTSDVAQIYFGHYW